MFRSNARKVASSHSSGAHQSYIEHRIMPVCEKSLALVGYEWLIIVAILIVIFLWGPQKLPELARSIGLAKKEFEKAAKEVSSTATSTTPMTEASTDPLIVAAKNLNISTEGKTKEEIAREIAERTAKKQSRRVHNFGWP